MTKRTVTNFERMEEHRHIGIGSTAVPVYKLTERFLNKAEREDEKRKLAAMKKTFTIVSK